MDPAILSASAALLGSLVGGISTLVGSWFTQRGQLRGQAIMHEAVKRETLYAEFIIEASKRLTQAWDHHAESPEVLAGLVSAVERMRLTSAPEVTRTAEDVVRQVIEAYAAPDRTFEELRKIAASIGELNPLQNFSRACRAELSALQG